MTLDAILSMVGPDVADPLTNPITPARVVTTPILDVPLLPNNPCARSEIITRNVGGASVAADPMRQRLPVRARVPGLLR